MEDFFKIIKEALGRQAFDALGKVYGAA